MRETQLLYINTRLFSRDVQTQRMIRSWCRSHPTVLLPPPRVLPAGPGPRSASWCWTNAARASQPRFLSYHFTSASLSRAWAVVWGRMGQGCERTDWLAGHGVCGKVSLVGYQRMAMLDKGGPSPPLNLSPHHQLPSSPSTPFIFICPISPSSSPSSSSSVFFSLFAMSAAASCTAGS